MHSDIRQNGTLGDWLCERILRYKDFVISDQGAYYRSNHILEMAEALSPELLNCRNKVVLLSETSGVKFLVLLVALAKAGAIIAPISPATDKQEVNKIGGILGAISLVSLTSDFRLVTVRLDFDSVNLPQGMQEGPGFIRFTSGTSAESKGVCIDSKAALARATSAAEGLCLRADDKVLWTLPMEYHFVAALLAVITAGATIVIPKSKLLDPQTEFRNFTFLYASPADIRFLINCADPLSFESLKTAVCTTGPISDRECEQFREKFGLAITRVFGAIEVGLGLGNLDTSAHQQSKIEGSIGRLLPGYQARIIGDEKIGPLAFKGAGLFNGYVNPLRQVTEVLHDGWFVTSDIAEVLEDGSIRILGRMDSAFNVGGYKVFPEEIERVIMDWKGVEEVLVTPMEHEILGSVASAQVVMVRGSTFSEIDLRRHCRSSLPAYKVPQQIKVVAMLKKTKTGKVIRWI